MWRHFIPCFSQCLSLLFTLCFPLPSFLPFASPPFFPSSHPPPFLLSLLQITMATEMNTVGLYKLWCSISNVYFLFNETITVLKCNQAAWEYGAVYISYIPQMEQHEPEGWMLFCLVDVTHSNSMPPNLLITSTHSTSCLVQSIWLLSNIQQSIMLYAV